MKLLQKNPGFTLVETILAVVVIALVIVATAELTQSSLRAGRITMNDFIAYHRAEEGLEIVRNIRDGNWLQNKTWKEKLAPGTYETNDSAPWELRATLPASIRLLNRNEPRFPVSGFDDPTMLRQNARPRGQTGLRQNSGLAAGQFKRIIEISYENDPADAKKETMLVKSTVSFLNSRGGTKSVFLTSELTDWKKGPL